MSWSNGSKKRAPGGTSPSRIGESAAARMPHRSGRYIARTITGQKRSVRPPCPASRDLTNTAPI